MRADAPRPPSADRFSPRCTGSSPPAPRRPTKRDAKHRAAWNVIPCRQARNGMGAGVTNPPAPPMTTATEGPLPDPGRRKDFRGQWSTGFRHSRYIAPEIAFADI